MQGLKHSNIDSLRCGCYTAAMKSSPRFAPVQAERAHNVVARQLRTAIIDGKYVAGDRLPNEEELARLCSVSRSAVRQALLLLRDQGLIEVRSGNRGGNFVAEQSTYEPVVQALQNQLALGGSTLQQLSEAKSIIEPVISAAAATSITDVQLEMLRKNVAASQRAVEQQDYREAFNLSLNFHAIIAQATQNPILEYMLVVLLEVAERAPEYQVDNGDRWQRLYEEHVEILAAFEERSSQRVLELMHNHVHSVEELFEEDD
jgi:DNA-binding FadR family transcriptional regulator